MDRGKSDVPRLGRCSSVAESTSSREVARSSAVVESTSKGVVSTRWKPTSEQKQILESMFASGTRNPSTTYIADITAQLERYGRVEGKNVFYWFQNANAREKRRKDESQTRSTSKWPAIFNSSKWPSLFRSKKSSDKNPSEDSEEADSGFRRNSSVNPSECTTLELFPLRPDRGGCHPANRK